MNNLIVGLGGTGGKTIRSLRKLIYSEMRNEDNGSLKNVQYLYVDSSNEMMSQTDPSWKVLGTSVQLQKASQLRITGEDLSGLLGNVNNYPGIRNWIGSETIWKEILGTIVGEALGGQKRRLGRFLFARQVVDFNNKLRSLVRDLQSNGDSSVTFHLVAGLAGGTGSGSIIDAITQIRKTYADPQRFRVMLYLLLPDQYPPANWDAGNYHANGFAALTELNALSTGAFKPTDVETGEQIDLKDAFNGAYLISNENENGYIAQIETEIPQLIAEFLYQKILIADTVGLTSITRMENAENGDGTPETSLKSTVGERSKRFLGFGLKRISIPEEEIQEYLTLSFASQAINQLRFNNWQDSLGYICEPINFDAFAFVKADDKQREWMIDDSHLLLEENILPSDDPKRQWRTLHSEWESVTSAFKQLAQEQDSKNWMTSLSSFYQNRYDESFRNIGVKEFYRTKLLAKNDMAREIRRTIEKSLLDEWRNGTSSIYDISRILEHLLHLLDERISGIESQKNKIEQRLDEVRAQIATNMNQWASLGIIGKALGKTNNVFERQALLLQGLYTDLTRTESLFFARLLTLEIISEIQDLKTVIDSFNSLIGESTDRISNEINQRIRSDVDTNNQEHLIKFYDPVAIRNSTRELTVAPSMQDGHALAVRSAILSRCGPNATFTKLGERMSITDLVDCITAASEQCALTAHSLKYQDSKQKILGVSILEKLQDRYGSDLPGLRLKIHELVSKAGTFLTINSAERDKVAPGIPSGSQVLVTKTIIVLPKTTHSNDFSEILKDAFRGAINGDLDFVDTDHQQNEITIITLKNLFPVRMIGSLPFLKNKYCQRIELNPDRMALELHTEGSLASYPSLFAANASDLRKLAGQNFLLGISLGLIRQDKTGRFYLTYKDSDGFDCPPIMLYESFSESIERIDFGVADLMDNAVTSTLGTFTSLASLESSIKQTVEDLKSSEGLDLTDPRYAVLIESAKSALSKSREAIQ